MTKRVTFSRKPAVQSSSAELTSDEWVDKRLTGSEMKRLTFDIPASLHRRIKVYSTRVTF